MPGTATVTVRFGDREYQHTVKALVCPGCGEDESVISNSELERVELHVARRLAYNGEATPDAFRFMRRALGFTGAEVAALLDVSSASVSIWEREANTMPRSAWLALAAMVNDRVEGRATISDAAKAAEHPREEHGVIALA